MRCTALPCAPESLQDYFFLRDVRTTTATMTIRPTSKTTHSSGLVVSDVGGVTGCASTGAGGGTSAALGTCPVLVDCAAVGVCAG